LHGFLTFAEDVPPYGAFRDQALATEGGSVVAPRTDEDLALRNEAIRAAGNPAQESGDARRAVHSGLTLPDYQPS
jgi:hypothetical protein